ncbi:hypothetical protein SPRG_12782 [Saprolegnia parasitica CBS 223.65]|uniref:Uncharacterized protein n=1 Tax=Saprolegnia parasitica (strain CBS 223.65) TaxID=695850 RepID=A0A067C697_SAPPC|nr:hypothetical protein SPRG_12782 [Saprolegnia parasitica CBS 223.65]KDO22322.1 hypothetical protein SPRG_12782 [Saprolegnia parasitica CBS 223.65]|eukprot:XP_012206956.1 hypothetical protein SPRG_12782 [Saprolegnia parasitica CBS 223.65]
MERLCAATVALMLATSATAASCTTDQNATINNFLAANVSTSCVASMPSWKSSMTFADGLYSDQYLMCRPPCQADLQNLTSRIPSCTDDAGTYTKVDQLNQLCTNMTRPTTNGGACTTGDVILVNGLMIHEPVWLNCSSDKNKNLYYLSAATTEEAKTLCASSTCTAFINSIAKLMPNCVREDGNNTMDEFRHRFGCTPAAVGANCSMVDMVVKYDAHGARLWSNCSTFLNASPTTTLGDLAYGVAETPGDLPSGFCASTCPANYLSTRKTFSSLEPAPTPAPTPTPMLLPSCTTDQETKIENFLAGYVSITCATSISSTCSTTGTFAVSGPMATFTVSTVSGVCGSVFTTNAKLSVPISFSTDCNQLTLSYTGTPSTLQRTSNAETAATSAMLLLGVFLAWGAL